MCLSLHEQIHEPWLSERKKPSLMASKIIKTHFSWCYRAKSDDPIRKATTGLSSLAIQVIPCNINKIKMKGLTTKSVDTSRHFEPSGFGLWIRSQLKSSTWGHWDKEASLGKQVPSSYLDTSQCRCERGEHHHSLFAAATRDEFQPFPRLLLRLISEIRVLVGRLGLFFYYFKK